MKSPGIKRSGKVREPCWESGQIMYRNVSSKCAAIVTTLFQAGSKVCYFRLFWLDFYFILLKVEMLRRTCLNQNGKGWCMGREGQVSPDTCSQSNDPPGHLPLGWGLELNDLPLAWHNGRASDYSDWAALLLTSL